MRGLRKVWTFGEFDSSTKVVVRNGVGRIWSSKKYAGV